MGWATLSGCCRDILHLSLVLWGWGLGCFPLPPDPGTTVFGPPLTPPLGPRPRQGRKVMPMMGRGTSCDTSRGRPCFLLYKWVQQ